MTHNKTLIRKEMRAVRRSLVLDADDKQVLLDALFDILADFSPNITLAFYWAIGSECDTGFLISECLKRGYKCCLPVVRNDTRVLSFASYDALEPMKKGAYGEAIPARSHLTDPDVIIMPLIAFDSYGGRLGQGGGYYDATLAHYRSLKNVASIGLAYAEQEWLNSALPIEDHDQKLDWIITPKGARKF